MTPALLAEYLASAMYFWKPWQALTLGWVAAWERHLAEPPFDLAARTSKVRRLAAAAAATGSGSRREKRCGKSFIKPEQVLDALSIAGEGLRAIATFHSTVKTLVRVNQFDRHPERVVKLSHCRLRV